MLDIKLIRENNEYVRDALKKKNYDIDFREFFDLDKKRRELIGQSEKLKAKKNKASSQIPMLKKKGEDVSHIFEDMKRTNNDIKELDDELACVETELNEFLYMLPNLPAEDVQAGGKENNETINEWGQKPAFEFEAKNHVDLVTSLKMVDYERGAKLGGNGFWIYRGAGAKLEWALLNYFIEEHEKDGYEFLLPPHILNYKCGFTAGQFPRFKEDVYCLRDDEQSDNLQFILPTAETALVNLHRDEILDESELPKKYYAYTPCYRKEAGSYRTDERGMIRGHQFNKIEMFQYTLPEESDKAFLELVEKAQRLVAGLGLYHRVTKLAAGDCSSAMAKTFDIEVWIPSMNDYKEVSSASNAHEYQARRGNIKVRKGNNKTEFLHTLNASGLATSRIIPAIVEQFQQEDGSVIIPKVLHKYFGSHRITIQK